jgi:pimeloyl-ACP methyl ester carboxylesterase
MRLFIAILTFFLAFMSDAFAATRYKTETIEGVKIFYREAGDASLPTIVLLHGYPTSSHMYRDLIPLLAKDFHVIAPDYPGFGYSDSPTPKQFIYSFDNYAHTMNARLNKIGVSKYYLYLQDYGGPVGFRMAVAHPEKIQGLVIQNANAYKEGVSEDYKALMMPLWKGEAGAEEKIYEFMKLPGTLWEYQTGVKELDKMSPDAWQHAQWVLDRPGNHDIQMALRMDAKSNGAEYPIWQQYFREKQPSTLIVWGAGDPLFTVAGAKAYLNDLPNAKLILLDTGHFALETHARKIATHIITWKRTQ